MRVFSYRFRTRCLERSTGPMNELSGDTFPSIGEICAICGSSPFPSPPLISQR
jgi:hypothetical protein